MRARVPDVGTVPPSAGTAPRVAPMFVVRSGGLPVAVLDDLAAPVTMSALRQAEDGRAAAARLAETVGDDLYRAVPRLMDQKVRRTAIGLRRDVHNGRWTARTQTAADTVAGHLPQEPADRLRNWAASARAGQERLSAADEAYPAEVQQASRLLQAALRTPRIAAGLALASPEFTERLVTEPLPAAPMSRFARSATAYLSRTAVKTSPFSALTTVGVAEFGNVRAAGRTSGAAAAGHTWDVSSARSVAVALLLACARNPAADEVVEVAAVDGLRRVDGRWLASLPTRTVVNGISFRVDELTSCDLYAWVVDGLPRLPVRLADLTGSAGPDGIDRQQIRRLVEIGLLQPVLPWSASSGRDFRELARVVGQRVGEPLAPFADALDRLAAQEAEVAGTRDAARRIVAIGAARTAVTEAFESLGAPVPSWATSTPLFHETDASAQAAAPGLPEVVREDLAEAGRWLAPLTVRHPLYDEMVRWFVRRHGPGAGGVDLLGFLYSFLGVADLAALARRTPGPHPGEGGADRLRGHGTLGHAGHAVFFQIAAADAASIADGEYDMIVNLVHSGATGLLSRWTGVPAVHERLAEPLARWVRQRHPGCTVYQVAAHGDWLDLQRPTLRTLPRLRCPGDLADPGADADLAELALAHDPATGTLQASGRDGAPVAFSYSGTVPQYLLTGPVQLLCLLSDPWISMGRVDRDRRVLDDGDSAGVTVLPQLRQDRIVWARKRWSFSPQDLPQPRHRQAPVEFLAEVDRWRSRHGLPDEVFVTQIVRGPTGAEKDKPQWLGFDHPHSIWAVLGHLRLNAARIDVAEALPHRGHHWAGGPDGRPVATEFLGLVSHA